MSHLPLPTLPPQEGLRLPLHSGIKLMGQRSARVVGVLTFCTKDKCPQNCPPPPETSVYGEYVFVLSPLTSFCAPFSIRLNKEYLNS